MGSIPGAYVAALLIAEIKALCIALGTVSFAGVSFAFPKLTLAVEFIFMAVVLVFMPWGLFGKPQAPSRNSAPVEAPLRPSPMPFRVFITGVLVLLVLLPLLSDWFPYAPVLALDVVVAGSEERRGGKGWGSTC